MVQYSLVAPPGDVAWDTSLIQANGQPDPAFQSLSSWVTGAVSAGRVAALLPL